MKKVIVATFLGSIAITYCYLRSKSLNCAFRSKLNPEAAKIAEELYYEFPGLGIMAGIKRIRKSYYI